MAERLDSYRGFAGHYDIHLMDWYAGTYGRRLHTLLQERGLARAKLLDAGCGTGTLALYLATQGHTVTGLDLSDSLLAVARAKDAAGTVRWLAGDITRLDLGETFDAITCVADVLNHLETLEDWELAFNRFAAHLRPGGLLFFDVMTCHGLEHLDTYTIEDRKERVLIVGLIWEPPTRRSTLKITSFVPAGETGLWERAGETITEWGQSVSEIYERLGRAGFETPERLWPIADNAEADERLAVLAHKR